MRELELPARAVTGRWDTLRRESLMSAEMKMARGTGELEAKLFVVRLVSLLPLAALVLVLLTMVMITSVLMAMISNEFLPMSSLCCRTF